MPTSYTLDECGKEVSLDTNSYITERDAIFAKINADTPLDPACMKEVSQIMNVELQAKLAANPQATFTATDLKTLISETKTVSAVDVAPQ